MIYLVIVLFILTLLYIYDVRGVKEKRIFWYRIVQVVLILLAGLRYRIGTDTPNYLHRFYNEYPPLQDFLFADYPIGGDGPLFVLMNSFVISLHGKFFMVQLLQASFVILLIFKYFQKHSEYLFTCALFYFILCYVQFNFEIMRGSMSIAVCLFANDYALEKKWIKAYSLYAIAFIFHAQALILFAVPLLLFLRLDFKGVIILLCSFVGGILIQHYFGEIIEMLSLAEAMSNKATRYADQDIYNGAGGNIFFYIVHIFPALLYGLFSLVYVKRNGGSLEILKMTPFVMLGLIFLILQMNLQILSRYVDYFSVYLVIIMAECAIMICNSKRATRCLSLTRCAVLFIPFFFLVIYKYSITYQRYLPYNSVLDRKIDKEREEAIYNPMIGDANISEF